MNRARSGDLLLGRYRLCETTPTDAGHVEVWSAHDQILDKAVRVSILTGLHVEDALDSARRAALVTDPRIVRILDVSSADHIGYVISEPVSGQSLTEIVAAGIVDPGQARAIIGEAAEAIETARQRGVHHLALRPSSITVDGSRVLLTGLGVDAGIAGLDQHDAHLTSLGDAQCLVALLYYLMTARWPGPSLDVDWIDPHAIHPLAARRAGSSVASLADIRSDVPADLTELCTETFTDHDGSAERWARPGPNGPPSAQELVARLAPWGEVSVVAALPSFVRPDEPEPAGVHRQSIRTVFGSSSVPPGTPPPAQPVRRPPGFVHALAAPGVKSGAPMAAPTDLPSHRTLHSDVTSKISPPGSENRSTTSTWSGPVAVAMGSRGEPSAMDPLLPFDVREATPRTGAPTRRFNPTWWALVVGVAVVAGAIWVIARGELFSFDSVYQTNPQESAQPSQSPTGHTEPPSMKPLIASGEPVDADGTGTEHPEWADRAYDGDPATAWLTRSYKSASFGNLKKGTGYVITLDDVSRVSSLTLVTGNTGGNVEVRATDAASPTNGAVLAEGSLSGTTVLTFEEPIDAKSLVLWFTQLPTATDGGHKVELFEIELS